MYAPSLVANPILCYSVSLVGNGVPDAGMAGPFQVGYSPPPPPTIVPIAIEPWATSANGITVTFAVPVQVNAGSGIVAHPEDVTVLSVGLISPTEVLLMFTTDVSTSNSLTFPALDPGIRTAAGAFVAADDYDVPLP